jgi:hypothetical protein
VWTNPRHFRHLRVLHRVSGGDCLQLQAEIQADRAPVSAGKIRISEGKRERPVRQWARPVRFARPMSTEVPLANR